MLYDLDRNILLRVVIFGKVFCHGTICFVNIDIKYK